MELIRQTIRCETTDADPVALCAVLVPGFWAIEAGLEPPDSHDPAELLGDAGGLGAMAVSLSSAALLGLGLGPPLIDHLASFGTVAGAYAGLALHELIVNAIIHGNLGVGSGASGGWQDLAERQRAIAAALADPTRAARPVTIALGWNASAARVVVADEGEGYAIDTAPDPKRAAGRGLRIARLVGEVEVRRGGRQTALTMAFVPGEEAGRE